MADDYGRRTGSAAHVAARLGELPASYEGELPCADCPAILYHLDLFADHLYFLRATYQRTQRQSDAIGGWVLAAGGTKLILAGGAGDPLGFAVEDATTLRWLKRDGREFTAGTSYMLKRATAFQPIEPRASLTGMYRHFADSGAFTPCGTQRRLPVAQEAENATLEATYVRLLPAPRGEVLAQVEGRVAMRPKMEGGGMQPALVVERVIDLRPGETCGAPLATAGLEDTYWKLTRLGDTPVVLKEKQAEPFLVLRSEDHRASGNAGCNRMTGQYTLDGAKLEFSKMVSTRMACIAGMDIEQAFLAALERARTWRIDGQHLELFDAAGQRVVRFEARALR